MGEKIEFHRNEIGNRPERRSPSGFRVIRREDLRLREFQARLDDLSDRLPKVTAETEVVWVKDDAYIFDPTVDLRVKLDAVRWMLKVAKHVEDPARERILHTVSNSIEKLERSVDRPHAA